MPAKQRTFYSSRLSVCLFSHAENFLTAIRQHDTRPIGQVDVWCSAFHTPPGNRQLIAELQCVLVPSVLLCKSASSTKFSLPSHDLALFVGHVKNDDGMRIDELHLE